MTTLKSLTIENYVLFESKARIDFQGKEVIQVLGINKDARVTRKKKRANASGKSLLMSAISSAVYSQVPLLSKALSKTKGKTSIKLALTKNGVDYTVTKKGSKYVVKKDGVDLEFPTASKSLSYVEDEVIQLPHAIFSYLVHLDPRNFLPLVSGTGASRKAFLAQLYDLSYLDAIQKKIAGEKKVLIHNRAKLDQAESMYEKLPRVKPSNEVSTKEVQACEDAYFSLKKGVADYDNYHKNLSLIADARAEGGIADKLKTLTSDYYLATGHAKYLKVKKSYDAVSKDDTPSLQVLEEQVKSFDIYQDLLEDYIRDVAIRKTYNTWVSELTAYTYDVPLKIKTLTSEIKMGLKALEIGLGASDTKCPLCLTPLDEDIIKKRVSSYKKDIRNKENLLKDLKGLMSRKPSVPATTAIEKPAKVSEVSSSLIKKAKEINKLADKLKTFTSEIKKYVGDNEEKITAEGKRLRKLQPYEAMVAYPEVSRSDLRQAKDKYDKVLGDRAKFKEKSHLLKVKKGYKKEIKELEKKLEGEKVTHLLSAVFSNKGIKPRLLKNLAQIYIDTLNDLSLSLSIVPTTYSYVLTETSFNILADRGGRVEDVATLSASESSIFAVLSVIAFKSLLGKGLPDFLILDEVTAFMDDSGLRLFVDKCLPELRELYSTVIIVSPKDLELSEVRTLTVVRENNASTIVEKEG